MARRDWRDNWSEQPRARGRLRIWQPFRFPFPSQQFGTGVPILVPGAINIVSLEGTDGQGQKWLDPERLAALYSAIPKDKAVYVYCHDGFRMSLAWMQLESLGYKNVRLYNAAGLIGVTS